MNPFLFKGIHFCRWVETEEKEASIRAEKIRKKYKNIRDQKLAEKLNNLYSLENKQMSDEELAINIQYELYK